MSVLENIVMDLTSVMVYACFEKKNYSFKKKIRGDLGNIEIIFCAMSYFSHKVDIPRVFYS
jgi:hypothetical protein